MSEQSLHGFEAVETDKQWLWWNPQHAETLGEHDFDFQALAASGSIQPVAGRGSACRIQSEDKDWFLRHYRRGGLVGKLLHDQYCWRGIHNTRVWQEIWHTVELANRGLPVPQVVGGRVQRNGLIYRGDLITQTLPKVSSMAECLRQLSMDEWQAIGACVARFHQQGLWHADLNTHNIQLNRQQVWLIDFDRARFRRPNAKWQQANLSRLYRSVCKVADDEQAYSAEWQALLNAYNKNLSL